MAQISIEQAFQEALRLHQQGHFASAETLYRQLAAHLPEDAEIQHLLGLTLHQTGQHAEARIPLSNAVRLAPQKAAYKNSLGEAYRALLLFPEAHEAYEQALALQPDYAEALTNLGNLQQQLGDLGAAETSHRRALALTPDSKVILNNLATTLAARQEHSQARECLLVALKIDPDYLKARLNLLNAHLTLREFPAALALAESLLRGKTLSAIDRLTIAKALKENEQGSRSIEILHELLTENPAFTEARSLLATCYHYRGEVDASLEQLDLLLQDKPDHENAAYSRLIALNYAHGEDGPRLWEAHQSFAARFYGHLKPIAEVPRVPLTLPSPRPWRVGYISNDFKNHSVSRFMLAPFEAHDSQQVEVHGFCLNEVEDAVTLRYQRAAHTWHRCHRWNDAELEERILACEIDILVDLGGHFGGRLKLLARHPAPIVISFLGYPNTTGVKNIDYRLTDNLADPIGLTDSWHSEKLWRLPGSAWCFGPIAADVSAATLPQEKNGFITFGCFHGIHKYRPAMMRAWAQILQQVPGSQLVLKSYRGLNQSETRHRFRQIFTEAEVDLNRLKFVPSSLSEADHFKLFNVIDIALDTFPYHGTTITCEGLWMGVPSVTLAGSTHVSRVGASLMTHAGLADWVATDIDHYIALAVRHAQHPEALAVIRAGLRETMRATALGDPQKYVRQLEEAYAAFVS
jgi:protein O-GlcNAc transferase